MIPPDEILIRYYDKAILWFHNRGLSRNHFVLIATFLLAFLDYVLTSLRSPTSWWIAPMLMVSPITLLVLISLNIKRAADDPKSYNRTSLFLRESWVAWVRFSLIFLLIWLSLTYSRNIYGVLSAFSYPLGLLLNGTLTPETPLGKWSFSRPAVFQGT